MSTPQFTDFIIQLCSDESFLDAFHEDAVKLMKAKGLSKGEIAIILSEDSDRINKYLEGGKKKPKWRHPGHAMWRRVAVAPANWKFAPVQPRSKGKTTTSGPKTAPKKKR